MGGGALGRRNLAPSRASHSGVVAKDFMCGVYRHGLAIDGRLGLPHRIVHKATIPSFPYS